MLNEEQALQKFKQIVENKYQIYNSLFMSLPYENMTAIGALIPFLYEESKDGFPIGKTPIQIIDNFFEKYTEISDEKKRLEILFRFVQYIERQVVLFDSIEDAAFSSLHPDADKGSIESIFQIAQQQGKIEAVKAKMQAFSTRIVFTAHPTQFYPKNVLKIITDLRAAIKADSISTIDMLLQQLGQTPFNNASKPTPLDEAMSIIYYLKHVYYNAVSELYEHTKDLFFENEPLNNAIIKLGFWPGGDRDGNPFVTADITKKVAEQLRKAVLNCYFEDLIELRRRLTFKFVTEPLKKICDKVYDEMILEGECNWNIEAFLQDLENIKTLLITHHNGLFLNELNRFIDKVHLFGFHFATLDIRQDSRIHQKVINNVVLQLIGKEFAQLTDEEKIEILTKSRFNVDPNDFEDEITRETLKNVKQLKTIQAQNGEKGTNRYIISNAESIFDVLNVYGLFKFCGYKDDEINFDIIPLFETIRGLDGAEKTMDTLYNLPIYASHLKRRNKLQTIMLGFSDGTKDGGYIKANWEIYNTKEILTNISKINNVDVIFFDGRGGPPARGGGKTHQFYLSQGNTIADNSLELTIQGQTITSNYGTHSKAKHNFEQLFTAGILTDVFEDNHSNLNESQREIINDLAELSYQKYADLKVHPLFVPYLVNRSTLNYYGKANIGSRPSKRGDANAVLDFNDLRAIPFVGSWSQLKQNVPGYFGVGTALNKYKQEGKFDLVKQLYRDSSFFKTLMDNSMMSMEKSYFPLTFYMKSDETYGAFWQILYDEFLLARDLSLELAGYSSLMEKEPLNKASVVMREKIVLPLLAIQQYALQKVNTAVEHKEAYERLIIRSLFGNINASRNSA